MITKSAARLSMMRKKVRVARPCLSTVRLSAGRIAKIMSHGTRARVIRYAPSGRWRTLSGTVGVFVVLPLPSGELLWVRVLGKAESLVEELES